LATAPNSSFGIPPSKRLKIFATFLNASSQTVESSGFPNGKWNRGKFAAQPGKILTLFKIKALSFMRFFVPSWFSILGERGGDFEPGLREDLSRGLRGDRNKGELDGGAGGEIGLVPPIVSGECVNCLGDNGRPCINLFKSFLRTL